MIERKFVEERIKEFQIQEYISENLKNVGHSHTKLQRTPMGEKIVIYAARPGLIVGRSGENIKKLTKSVKKKFELENPQIEISEVQNVYLDPRIVAERIASSLERFGIGRFKGVGHKMMTECIRAGARGIEILISGKVPSARAKAWRFYQGYIKKCGDVASEHVRPAYAAAQLKTGTVGIQVSIMPPDIRMPGQINAKVTVLPVSAGAAEGSQVAAQDDKSASEKAEGGEDKPKKKAPRKRAPKKKEEKVQEEPKNP